MSELPPLDPIVEAFLEKEGRKNPDGSSCEDYERDLSDPIKALRDELLSARSALALAAEDDAGRRETENKMRDWLLKHESDIAHGINDFGELQSTFHDLTGRQPQGER